jgi:hypothetical protein
VELQQLDRHRLHDAPHRKFGLVHEQADQGDEGRHVAGNLPRLLDRHAARTGAVEDQAERVGAEFDRGARILGTGEAADLDAGARHCQRESGSKGAMIRPFMGNCQRGSYPTPERYRPAGEKVGAAWLRSRAAISLAIHSGRMRALADIHQGADHIAHHVVQKGVGAELEDDAVALASNLRLMQRLHRRLGLALGGAKGGKVPLARQQSGAGLHGHDIERQVEPADSAVQQRRTHGMVVEHVAVAARAAPRSAHGNRPAPRRAQRTATLSGR